MEVPFLAILAVWTACSLLRLVHLYDASSPFQRWRRWDWFSLVSFGAYFGPRPPEAEPCIVVRDVLPDGRVTPWAEVAGSRSRVWWHVVWNPQKHAYMAKVAAAQSLLAVAERLGAEGERLPQTILLTRPYLALLRYATDLPRLSPPRATQFGVLQVDVSTRRVRRTVVSFVHEV